MVVVAFGQNNPNWTLDSMVGSLESIQDDEEEIQERRSSKKRALLLEKLGKAIQLLNECCEGRVG